MAPGKWDDEDSDSSASSAPAIARRNFSDEEEDSDVPDSWELDEEVKPEKPKEVVEVKAKPKPRSLAEITAIREAEKKQRAEEMEVLETPAERKARETQEALDDSRRQAEDLFGDIGISDNRAVKPVVVSQSNDPTSAVDLSALPLFNPKTKDQFGKLRETLTPLLAGNAKAPQYSLFLQEFTKAIARDLPSEQIKKIASGLTTLSNEKMREEKAAEKGGKKSKAAKTKTSLVATRDVSTRADTLTYEDDFGDDDFM